MTLEASDTTSMQPPFVPGTVLLVDDTHEQSTKHATGKHTEIVLIPPPSDDPNDPLPVALSEMLKLIVPRINFYGVAYDGLAPDLNTTFDGLNTGCVLLRAFGNPDGSL
ncbi:hypothetical protein APSETT444_003604 [Aspergillus pseudonomiae]